MGSQRLLNDAQQRHLSISCQHIDRRLCEAGEILRETESPSPFPRHIPDVTPEQARVIADHMQRIREQLLLALAWEGLKPEPAEIPASHALIVMMAFIDITIEEMKPGPMRGCGAVSEEAAAGLNNVVRDLRAVTQGMEQYIRQEFGVNRKGIRSRG